MPPRFKGAPSIVETTRSHEMPDFDHLPEGSDVTVEIYGGAVTLWLRGDRRRVYVERFTYRTFTNEDDARAAFLSLWREVEALDSPAAVERAALQWHERMPSPRD